MPFGPRRCASRIEQAGSSSGDPLNAQLRYVGDDEIPRYLHFVRRVFTGHQVADQELVSRIPSVRSSRNLAAFDNDLMVGTASWLPISLTVPGGATLAAAGVTLVAVRPTHRRRGL